MRELEDDLKMKIKRKIATYQLNNMKSTAIPILTHGCFTRFKIFRTRNTEELRLLDFETITYGSPCIDFGRIFFTNLPGKDKTKLARNFGILLRHYTDSLKNEYPDISDKISVVIQDIIYNMLFSYIYLEDDESEAIEDHVAILHMLDMMGGLESKL